MPRHKKIRIKHLLTLTSIIFPLTFLALKTAIDRNGTSFEEGQVSNLGPQDGPVLSMRHTYAGPQACRQCHEDIHQDFIQTHHFLSSSKAKTSSFFGSFKENENILPIDGSNYFDMVKSEEDVYIRQWERSSIRPHMIQQEKVDLIIGSGKLGHTYLYWLENGLVRNPVALLGGDWAFDLIRRQHNVRYDTGMLATVTPVCLDCHSTYFEYRPKLSASAGSPFRKLFEIPPGPKNLYEYNKENYILGISCEKCHGPGLQHVQFHQKNPDISSPSFILNPAHFSRKQRMDLCAQCHSGPPTSSQQSFAYIPGAPLESFKTFPQLNPDPSVHANQVGLLISSKCYQQSPQMTCMDCHHPHQNERNNLALHSSKCLKCHEVPHKHSRDKSLSVLDETMKGNCIDCHMPKQEAKDLLYFRNFSEKGQKIHIRNHRIGVYLQESTDLLQGQKEAMQ